MNSKDHPNLPLLLVDDEPTVLHSTKLLLSGVGIRPIITVGESRDLLPLLDDKEVAVIVLDLFMPHLSGVELLPKIIKLHPEIPVIVLTAAQDVETAVSSMKEGAFDYLVKPVEESRLISSVKRAMEMRYLRRHVNVLKDYLLSDKLDHAQSFVSFNTINKKMHSIFQYAEAIAISNEPVLITGETGVGKELLARSIHQLSGRKGKLMPVNVAGLDDVLFSDTLFGHKKGAFTGAVDTREGMVAAAAGGTLFLDEIGDLAKPSQIKLLRLLQENRYHPLGSDIAKNSDVRIICATNLNLEQQMAEDLFRSDLFYRLSVHQIELPPLRQRMEDVPLLVNQFIEKAARSMGKNAPSVPIELYDLLGVYRFAGNIRELRALVYDATAAHRSGAFLSLDRFRKAVEKQQALHQSEDTVMDEELNDRMILVPGKFPSLTQTETCLVHEAMKRANGNQGVAATLLGISRPALNRRLVKINKKP
ncbi:MAG: sigma-54 dependent transcriptional regulator [Candidatus Thiodiazotropha sp. (ex Troendleina suluensis)]|nr:sigma-54 dependent transcriptional regulator [Candidatus Thiodiazotropha sp. (ex Troendleina suluensis)]